MSVQPHSFRRRWALPVLFLGGSALMIFWCLYSLDHWLGPAPEHVAPQNPFERYLNFDAEKITDAVSSLAGMIAAVFGIVITVVSIIVQLSADRYTGVARMFLRDKVNLGVMTFYVIACVCGVWLSVSLQDHYVPRVALLTMLVATTGGLVLMGPYFGYVFWFLEPMNIIDRIRHGAVQAATYGSGTSSHSAVSDYQSRTLGAMEELTDITSNSISGKDKIIASGAVDALKDFALEYLKNKSKASSDWFSIGEYIAK